MTTIADRTASIASLAAAACERTATYEGLNTATTAAWAAVEAAKVAVRDAEAAALVEPVKNRNWSAWCRSWPRCPTPSTSSAA